MSKGNKFLVIAIALIGVGALLELRFHKSPAGAALDSAAKSVTVAPASPAQSPHGHSPVGETVEPNTSTSKNIDRESPPAAIQNFDLEEHPFDRDFAAAAAKPYVEMYQREHPTLKVGTFDWTEFQAIYASAENGSNAKGYIVVFFTASRSPGAGFTCFKVKDEASDHLEPVTWGFAANLAQGIENFRRAAKSNGCVL
jgi:hypothetical protein